VSSSSADADALSTIAFIQGTKKISVLLEEVNTTLSNADSASAILISNQGKVF
jgi:thiamine biosynthesis lipoprotein ApbE